LKGAIREDDPPCDSWFAIDGNAGSSPETLAGTVLRLKGGEIDGAGMLCRLISLLFGDADGLVLGVVIACLAILCRFGAFPWLSSCTGIEAVVADPRAALFFALLSCAESLLFSL